MVDPLFAWTHAEAREGAGPVAASLLQSRVAREILYANVVEACARDLGDERAGDWSSDVDVTLALVRLQTLVRFLGYDAPVSSFVPHSVLVATAPQEHHGLGMAIASECFHAAGWDVAEALGANDRALAAAVRGRHFDALVLSLSGARPRMERLDALTHTIDEARHAAADDHLVVIVTGRAFTDGHACAKDVGADCACASAADTPQFAGALVDLQQRHGEH